MSEYTPGPWELGGRFEYHDARFQWNVVGIIGGKGGRTIAEVGEWADRPNAQADARLIAAAPELYEALLALRASSLVCTPEHDPYSCFEPSCRMTRAALAKARGEE